MVEVYSLHEVKQLTVQVAPDNLHIKHQIDHSKILLLPSTSSLLEFFLIVTCLASGINCLCVWQGVSKVGVVFSMSQIFVRFPWK